MNKFGLFIHTEYYDRQKQSEIIRSLNDNYDIEFYGFDDQLDILPDFVKAFQYGQGITLNSILVFGGDGTILRAKKYALLTNAPLLGINIGKLGFLSETKPELLERSIKLLINNRYKVQSRLLLDIKVYRENKLIYRDLALNDAVLFRANTPKMIEVKIRTNNRLIYTTRCDGLVASTPTGSTAYSLSGGGPILDPLMEAIVFCPLNPHILSIRPIVFSAKDLLSFELITCHDEPMLQVDGVNVISLLEGDIIKINGATKKVDFIKLSNKTFYQIMRKKMHMGRI
jgi:NAD+ kinase